MVNPNSTEEQKRTEIASGHNPNSVLTGVRNGGSGLYGSTLVTIKVKIGLFGVVGPILGFQMV